MRITNRMMMNSHQRNLSRNLNRLHRVENQIVTGRLVNKPSDNPVNATRIMGYQNQIARNDQIKRNIEESILFSEMADTTLKQVNDQMQRIKELTMQAANGTESDVSRGIIADEIEELTKAIVQFMNVTNGEQFIFGGSVSNKAPFELVDGQIVYHGNDEITQVSLAPGITIGRNIPGSQLLGAVVVGTDESGNDIVANLFDTLSGLSEAIRAGDDEQLQELMSHLDQHISNISLIRTQVGITHQRLEMSLTSTENINLNLTESLSKIQDVDFAEKSIELAILETTYLATIQIAAQISRPTLLNFLR